MATDALIDDFILFSTNTLIASLAEIYNDFGYYGSINHADNSEIVKQSHDNLKRRLIRQASCILIEIKIADAERLRLRHFFAVITSEVLQTFAIETNWVENGESL